MNNKAQPAWLKEKEYPFKDHYFKTALDNIHYVDEGTIAPILLLLKNPGWPVEYCEIVKKMSNTRYCIAADCTSFELSKKTVD